MNNLTKAIQFAILAHEGQFDKAGLPYILHPLRVMSNLKRPYTVTINSPYMERMRIVAVLHDVLEDTDKSISEIMSLFDYETYELSQIERNLQLLNRKNYSSYEDYIHAIWSKGEIIAVYVKYADLLDNTSLERMKHLPLPEQQRLRAKYDYPLSLLREVVISHGWE